MFDTHARHDDSLMTSPCSMSAQHLWRQGKSSKVLQYWDRNRTGVGYDIEKMQAYTVRQVSRKPQVIADFISIFVCAKNLVLWKLIGCRPATTDVISTVLTTCSCCDICLLVFLRLLLQSKRSSREDLEWLPDPHVSHMIWKSHQSSG